MNDLKETSSFCTELSALNVVPKLKKLFKLSKFPIIATFSFDPAITAGIGMLYTAGEGIINHIEIENMKTFLQEYIERKIDEHFKLEDQAECELVLQSIIKSLRCSRNSQIKRIVDILQETIEYNELKYDEAEDFINVVSELSEREAILLARCYRYFSNHTLSPKFTVKDVEVFGNINKDSWDYLLNRLEGKGLLNSEPTSASWKDIDENFFDKGDDCMRDDDYKEKYLALNTKTYGQTEFGRRLFQSLHSDEHKIT